MKRKLLEKTDKRLKNTLDELKSFAEENNISLKEAIDLQLIDALRGISHRIYEGSLVSKEKTRIL